MNNFSQVHPLDTLPMLVIFLFSVGLLLLAYEIGFRISFNYLSRRMEKDQPVIGALVSAILALIAFLLAFVTSASVSSFSARRQAIINDANAIGTAYLRAGYLSPPISDESRQLLRDYLETRLEATDRSVVADLLTRAEEIQNELWLRAETLAREEPTPVTSLYIAAINDVIDLHTERVNVALVARVPWEIVLGLFFMTFLAMVQVGLNSGFSGNRSQFVLLTFVVTFSVVFLLIVDLGRSNDGLLTVSQQAYLDLARQMVP